MVLHSEGPPILQEFVLDALMKCHKLQFSRTMLGAMKSQMMIDLVERLKANQTTNTFYMSGRSHYHMKTSDEEERPGKAAENTRTKSAPRVLSGKLTDNTQTNSSPGGSFGSPMDSSRGSTYAPVVSKLFLQSSRSAISRSTPTAGQAHPPGFGFGTPHVHSTHSTGLVGPSSTPGKRQFISSAPARRVTAFPPPNNARKSNTSTLIIGNREQKRRRVDQVSTLSSSESE